jgi:hypothetical protein
MGAPPDNAEKLGTAGGFGFAQDQRNAAGYRDNWPCADGVRVAAFR